MSEQSTPFVWPLISVVGGATCSDEEADLALEVGRLAAAARVGIVCGGGGGVMEAVCKGACEGGGLTVGILPGVDPAAANPWVQVAIASGLGEARNALVARSGQGVIAIGGGYGTLSEIALALKWGKRVAGLQSWSLPGVHQAATPVAALAYILDKEAKP